MCGGSGVTAIISDGETYVESRPIAKSPLNAADNLNLVFSTGARFVEIPSSGISLYLMRMTGVENVTIKNFSAWGDNTEIVSGGATNTGLTITGGCKGIRMLGYCKSSNFRGDGIVIRNSEDVKIYSGEFKKNSRLGCALNSGKDIYFYDSEFSETGGWGDLPEQGIDIEPDYATERLENINLIRPLTRNNVHNASICIALQHFGPVLIDV